MNPMDLLQGDGIAWTPYIYIFINDQYWKLSVPALFINISGIYFSKYSHNTIKEPDRTNVLFTLKQFSV